MPPGSLNHFPLTGTLEPQPRPVPGPGRLQRNASLPTASTGKAPSPLLPPSHTPMCQLPSCPLAPFAIIIAQGGRYYYHPPFRGAEGDTAQGDLPTQDMQSQSPALCFLDRHGTNPRRGKVPSPARSLSKNSGKPDSLQSVLPC